MFLPRVVVAAGLVVGLVFAPLPAQAETLREALSAAYANNPNITSALLAVQAAAEEIVVRRAGRLPNISASADVGATWTASEGMSSTSSSGSIGLNYRQNLFDGLQTEAQIEQARAMAEASSQALRNAEQNVLLSAATAYYNVIRDTQFVQLRQDNVTFLQAQVQSASDRLAIGEGTRIDVTQAEAQLAQAVASYRAAVNDLQTSQAAYVRWIGHNPQNLSMEFDFGALIPIAMDVALNTAETHHPAILGAHAQIRAAQFGSSAAQSAFAPTLDLIGSIGSNWSDPGTTSTSGSVRLQLSIPIYSGGALGANARRANLQQIQSEVDAWATRDQVREAVISSWGGLMTATAQIESAGSMVQATQATLDGIIEEQQVGQRTMLDVLNARADLTSAREAQIGAQSARMVASFSLLSAMGQLGAMELQLPVEVNSADGYTARVQDVWQELRSLPE